MCADWSIAPKRPSAGAERIVVVNGLRSASLHGSFSVLLVRRTTVTVDRPHTTFDGKVILTP